MFEAFTTDIWALIVAGGFLVGFLVGMTGVGAGSLMTPFLIGGIGVAPAVAVGTDLLFAAITKASAAARHHKLGNVDWPIVLWLAAGSLPGALAVLAIFHYLTPDMTLIAVLIKRTLAGALIVSALAVALYPLLMRGRDRPDQTPGETSANRWATLVLGLVLGSVVTITSVGAGAIGVVVLTALYPLLITRKLIGTDIVHAIPLTLVSGLGHMSLGHVDFGLLAVLLLGSIPGIALGSRLTGWLPDWLLRLALAAVLCMAAYQLFMKS